MEKLLTREDIARYLGISRMQLYRWGKVNPLPIFYSGYGNRNWDQDAWTTQEADEWMKETKRKLLDTKPRGYYC